MLISDLDVMDSHWKEVLHDLVTTQRVSRNGS